mmetsp:Transcript_24571/g.41781  ORF Transcript_24571/g.41781 Transcript_24571/m.41781 type:complete len:324 (-) Transcript_24571:101-1072(-)
MRSLLLTHTLFFCVIRIPPKLGKAFADLHCAPFDRDFNSSAGRSPCVLSFFSMLKDGFADMLNNKSYPRTNHQMKTLGKEQFFKLVDYSEQLYMESRDCLIHSDAHLFNILVERRGASPEAEVSGQVTVCDWEMSVAGPTGRDLGLMFPWPLMSSVAHGRNRDWDKARHVMDTLHKIWECYSEALKQNGKSPDFVEKTYQSILGWTGWFMLLAHHLFPLQSEYLPSYREVAGRDDDLIDAAGVLGLKLLELGFGQATNTIDVLQKELNRLIETEVAREPLPPTIRETKPRRASSIVSICTTGRRLSDTCIAAVIMERKLSSRI